MARGPLQPRPGRSHARRTRLSRGKVVLGKRPESCSWGGALDLGSWSCLLLPVSWKTSWGHRIQAVEGRACEVGDSARRWLTAGDGRRASWAGGGEAVEGQSGYFFFFWTGKVSHSRGSFAMVGLRLPAHCDVWGAWVLADQSSCREDRGQSMVVDTGRIVSLRARIWPAWWQVWQGLQDPQMAQVNGAFCLHGFSVPASSILASPATMAMSSTQKCTG